MSEREQFEAAIKALAELPEDSHETPYPDEDANTYWAIWQASRRAALEEAAAFIGKRADEFSACGNHTADTMARIYEAEAAAIRKLAKETNNG